VLVSVNTISSGEDTYCVAVKLGTKGIKKLLPKLPKNNNIKTKSSIIFCNGANCQKLN
jgi:hypothetical protein